MTQEVSTMKHITAEERYCPNGMWKLTCECGNEIRAISRNEAQFQQVQHVEYMVRNGK